jgi:hypothetical protein
MAEKSRKDIQELSPDKLMRRFRRSGILVCVIAAFALHVVLIGGTSVDYIHGMIDPAWAERQEEARRQQAARKRQADARRRAPTTTSAPATAPSAKAKAKPSPGDTGAGEKPKRKIPKELIDKPKPGEIPGTPGSGISIDETEGK